MNTQVTLVGLDTFAPERTLNAVQASMALFPFSDTVLVCRRQFSPVGGWGNVRPHFVDIDSERLTREYYLLEKLWTVFETSHCLHHEWDAGVKNPARWDDAWLEYDYIGAPWDYPKRGEWPPCHEGNCVGNSGFALISRKFLKAVSDYKATPHQARLSDVWMCRGLRPLLEKRGLKFAPKAVAAAFSCENIIYSGQFGWHGRNTARMNGWTIES